MEIMLPLYYSHLIFLKYYVFVEVDIAIIFLSISVIMVVVF